MDMFIIVFLGVFSGIFLLVAFICSQHDVNKRERVKREQEQQARMKYKDIMPGDYLFPAEKFYEQCEKDGWNDIDNDIHIRKMILVAKNLIKADGKDYAGVYNAYASAEQVKKFFSIVKTQKQIDENKMKMEREEKESRPQPVTLSYNENSIVQFNQNCKNFRYAEKRREYLKNLIRVEEATLWNAESKYKAAEKNWRNSFYTNKGNDWAIAGGIANAIAGPAAGVMVASQVIADNEANKSFNNLVTRVAWDKTYDAEKVLDASKERLQKYKDDLASLDTKIVFEEIPSEELCGKLIINAALNEQQNNMLEVSIRNNYCKKMDVTTVVDGTIQVKVFCDGNLLEEVCVALPCYGVRSRKTNVVKTFLHYKMIPGKANYSFETEPNFLWLMEE